VSDTYQSWQQFSLFSSDVYILNKPEFLHNVKTISYEYLNETKKYQTFDEIYGVYQSNNFNHDPRLSGFNEYISKTSYDILSSQGYDMMNKEAYCTHIWMHHCSKYASAEQHIHANNSQISGFYILECPENCSKMLFHDPRPGKIQMNFGFNNDNITTSAKDRILFNPEPGMLLLFNSWLPHSFTRNESHEPFTFIHFNIKVDNAIVNIPPPAEVI
jgi:uncharacterized protein (TIGR02466 family)